MICFSHTVHNSIIAGVSISSVDKIIKKVHDNNVWFKRNIMRMNDLGKKFIE